MSFTGLDLLDRAVAAIRLVERSRFMERARVLENQVGLLNLLRNWRDYAEWAREIHNIRQSRYANLNFGFGIPIAVLSITVSTATVAFLGEKIGTSFRLFGAVFSLLAGVRAALQTFIKPSERSMERQIAACGYSDLVREMDQCLANPPDSVEELDQAVKEYGQRLEKLEKESPGLPTRKYTYSRREERVAAHERRARGNGQR